MSHHHLHTDASTSAIHDTHPGDGPPVISPRRVPAEEADFTGAASGPPGACGAPAAGRPNWAANGRHGSPAPPGCTTRPPAASEERPSLRPGPDRAIVAAARPGPAGHSGGLVRMGRPRPADRLRAGVP